MIRLLIALFILGIGLSTLGLSESAKVTKPVELIFTNSKIGGKSTWVLKSARAKLTTGTVVNATLVNKLNSSHGFQVTGGKEPVLVGAKKTVKTTFTITSAGFVKYDCHLHPDHVGGAFVVK